ncbi:hypothetical protein ACQVQY_26975 [Bacillus mycoides]|uniref:hypothetical protein n=1 Tax=Bacillus TaxID=1386 RepID=UPI00366AC2C2
MKKILKYSNEFENLLKQVYSSENTHINYAPHSFLGAIQVLIADYEMNNKKNVPIKELIQCLESSVKHSNQIINKHG